MMVFLTGARAGKIIEFADRPFVVRGSIVEGLDVSGVAVDPDGRVLVAVDEGSALQLCKSLGGGAGMVTEARLPLPVPGKGEGDFEAAAYMDGHFYVVGSHGVSKKKGKVQDSRCRIFRLSFLQGAGEPQTRGVGLGGLLSADPVLGSYFRKPLQQKGVNIEGLAAVGGRLYVGLRSPNLGGDAFVLEVCAEGLFGAKKTGYKLRQLPLGHGLGIREIAVVKGGFLILAGNAGSAPSLKFPLSPDFDEKRPYPLFFWSGEKVVPLGNLPESPGKAEGLLVTVDEMGWWEVVVFYDSVKNGGARRFRVDKP